MVLLAASAAAAQELDTSEEGSKHHHGGKHKPRFENVTVHLVISNHLDVGFGGIGPFLATDVQVINTYFSVYFPKAIEVARKLRERGGEEQLKWMTQSFLVSMYLDCPPNMGLQCPSKEEVEAFGEAVRAGDIWWHGMPHNAQIEVFDESLLEYAIQMGHDLAARFNMTPAATISQRDVPGITRSAIPTMAAQGIKAVNVGVNHGSAPPGVPKDEPFVWRDLASGTQVLAFWHPGGYGGYTEDDCVMVKHLGHILCTYWKGDNAGPPSVDELLQVYSEVGANFPGAKVVASTFDEYLEPLMEMLEEGNHKLQVITAEIGDTWIHGIASDPYKLSEYRALLRIRKAIHWDSPEPWFVNFSRMLVKLPEHTWGEDIKTVLADEVHWSNPQLRAMVESRDLHHVAIVDSWQRQRCWNQYALDALAEDPRGVQALQQHAPSGMGLTPKDGDVSLEGYTLVPQSQWDNLVFQSGGRWRIGISNKTGAITRLQRLGGKEVDYVPSWASHSSPLLWLQYQALKESDYEELWRHYTWFGEANMPWWFRKDFGKDGADSNAPTRSTTVTPRLERLHVREADEDKGEGMSLAIDLRMPKWSVRDYGGCERVHVRVTDQVDPPVLRATVVCQGKTPTRLPEGMWVRFRPNLGTAVAESWRLTKLGRPIHPHAVMRNGSRSLHAVGDEGVYVTSQSLSSNGARQRMTIQSLDAMLVSPGLPTLMPNLRRVPDLTKGVSFNLWNNIWGTNYVMWLPYDEKRDGADLAFNFIIKVDDVSEVDLVQEARVDREEEVLADMRAQGWLDDVDGTVGGGQGFGEAADEDPVYSEAGWEEEQEEQQQQQVASVQPGSMGALRQQELGLEVAEEAVIEA